MNRLLWTCGVLLAAAWMVPVHVLPWMSWHSEAVATVAILFGCTGALWVQYRSANNARVHIPWLALLPLSLAGCAILQWVAGRIVYAGSLWTILSYAALCVAAACAGYGVARQEHARSGDTPSPALTILAHVLLWVGILQLAIVFGQAFQLWDGSDWIARTAHPTRGGGNVAQANHAAHLFLLAMAATVYLRQTGRLRAGVAAVAMLAAGLGLATTQSRSGLLALAALVAWYVLRRRDLPQRPSMTATSVMMAGVVVLFALWPAVTTEYWQNAGERVNLTTSGRTAIWMQLLDAVWLRPWFGWGVMQVAEAQNAIAHAYPKIYASTFAHNLFFDLALWAGIPAMLAGALMMFRWLWTRLPAARSLDACFCVGLAIPLAVQAMTEFPYAYSYFLVPAFFALGMLDASLGRGALLRLPRAAAAGMLAVWIGGTAWAMLEYVRIEEDFRVARFEALRVGATPAAYEAPDLVILTQLEALLRATRLQAVPNMAAEDIALLRNIAMLHPWGATNFRYALALALNGEPDQAVRQLQVVRAMNDEKSFARLMTVIDEMAVQYPVLKQLRQP